MASYLTVISNDTLTHRALQGSPETLCGKTVVDVAAPRDVPELNTITGGPLTCDICETLSGGGSFLKENVAKITEAGRACPHCRDGFDSSGNLCEECGGSGWLNEGDDFDDYYEDLTGIDTDDLRGTKVAAETPVVNCDRCGEPTSITKTVGNQEHCLNCVLEPTTPNTEYKSAGWKQVEGSIESLDKPSTKEATNWTRDGTPIEDGFTVVTIDKDQAARTPFLDFSKVAVSEKRTCPDCSEAKWLSKIASCDSCGLLKCNSCMESIGPSQFIGMCKRCTSSESDLAYETEYSDPYPAQDLYLDYLMSGSEEETDPLFLPSNYDE